MFTMSPVMTPEAARAVPGKIKAAASMSESIFFFICGLSSFVQNATREDGIGAKVRGGRMCSIWHIPARIHENMPPVTAFTWEMEGWE